MTTTHSYPSYLPRLSTTTPRWSASVTECLDPVLSRPAGSSCRPSGKSVIASETVTTALRRPSSTLAVSSWSDGTKSSTNQAKRIWCTWTGRLTTVWPVARPAHWELLAGCVTGTRKGWTAATWCAVAEATTPSRESWWNGVTASSTGVAMSSVNGVSGSWMYTPASSGLYTTANSGLSVTVFSPQWSYHCLFKHHHPHTNGWICISKEALYNDIIQLEQLPTNLIFIIASKSKRYFLWYVLIALQESIKY